MQQPKAWPGFETTHHHTAPQAPPMWRAPAGPERAGCGAHGRWQGQAAVLVGGGRARAGLEIDHSER